MLLALASYGPSGSNFLNAWAHDLVEFPLKETWPTDPTLANLVRLINDGHRIPQALSEHFQRGPCGPCSIIVGTQDNNDKILGHNLLGFEEKSDQMI